MSANDRSETQTDTEQRLRRERDLLTRILRKNPAGIITTDRDGQIVFASANAERVLGLTINEITQRNYNSPEWKITDLDGRPFPDEDLPFRHVMASGKRVSDLRHAIEWPNGRRVLLSVNGEPLLGNDGQIDGVVATVEDITERIYDADMQTLQRDLALQLGSMNDLRSAMQHILRTLLSLDRISFDSGGMYLVNDDGSVDLIVQEGLSDEFAARTAHYDASAPQAVVVRRGQPVYLSFSELITQEELETRNSEGLHAVAVIPVTAKGQAIAAINLGSHEHVGTPPDVRVLIEGIAAQLGSTIARIKAETKERQTRANLQRERDQAQMYLDIASVILIAINRDRRVTLINKKGCEIIGLSEEDILGQDWFERFLPDEDRTAVREQFDHLMAEENEPKVAFENAILTADGRKRTILWRNTVVRDEDGRVVGTFASGEDITERKRMEQELVKATKLESIGTLAGGIAHDFNNILTGILGNVSLAKAMASRHPDVVAILKESESACERATDLTYQLLTFATGGEPVKETASIAEILNEAASFAFRGSNVRCESSIKHDVSPVEVDSGQIFQVFSNIFINADQAMPRGGVITVVAKNVEITPEAHLPLAPGRYVQIEAKDNGPGIDAKDLKNVFDPFFTTKFSGSGLGLSTAYSIIRRHKGLITAASEPGEGAAFDVYLPAAPPDAQVFRRMRTKEAPAVSEKHVLVMDDEAMILKLTGKLLKSIGCRSEQATHGAEAIEKYVAAMNRGDPFDLVILDLTVPGGMGGKETMEQLVTIDPDVKAIVSSGYSNDPVMANHQEHNFVGVVSKPFRLEELKKVFDRIEQRH